MILPPELLVYIRTQSSCRIQRILHISNKNLNSIFTYVLGKKYSTHQKFHLINNIVYTENQKKYSIILFVSDSGDIKSDPEDFGVGIQDIKRYLNLMNGGRINYRENFIIPVDVNNNYQKLDKMIRLHPCFVLYQTFYPLIYPYTICDYDINEEVDPCLGDEKQYHSSKENEIYLTHYDVMNQSYNQRIQVIYRATSENDIYPKLFRKVLQNLINKTLTKSEICKFEEILLSILIMLESSFAEHIECSDKFTIQHCFTIEYGSPRLRRNIL